jgi:CheY-like chemotaxis protein/tetratricopeptide (TPR) repeat protein
VPPTLLCVDADRGYCEILARTFQAEGYRVHAAHDGDAALAAVRSLRPDLVTLDVLLPKRDGFAVLEALRTAEAGGRPVPVLFLTGCSPTPAYRSRAERLGALGLLTKPVPLDRLLALVAQQLGNAGKPARETARPARGPARAAAQLEGALRDIGFAGLLHHLHGLRASGVLHLESGKKKKRLQLADGRPVAVKSNLVNETLGQLLAASGRITLDVMHESLLRVKRGEGLHGQILVAMHMLDEQDLAHALRHQAEEKLLEIFEWPDGRYRFQRGVRLSGGNVLSLRGSPANLVVRGVMTRVPPDTVDAFFAARGDERVGPSRSPFYRFQDIALDPAGEALLQRVDGAGTLSDLLPLDERSRRLLYALHAIEMIELAPRGARAPRVADAPGEPAPAPEARALRAPAAVPLPPIRRLPPQDRAAAPPRRSPTPERPRPAAAPLPPPSPTTAPRRARPAAPVEARRPAAATDPPSARPSAPRSAAAAPRPVAPAARTSAPPEPPASPEEDALRADLASMAERLRGRDFFAVLGISRSATDDEIRDAYFALAKRTHPDRFSGASEALRRAAEELFSLVSRAYETLGHRDRRNQYLRVEMTRERDRAEIEEGERALRAELAFQKGLASLKRKAHETAVDHFREAVGQYPAEGEYHAYFGFAFWLADPGALGRVEEARQHILKGRKLAPGSDKPYLFLGRLYKAEGKDPLAERMFQKVVELDPDCVDAIRELRLIDMRRQRSKSLVQRILRR